MIHLSDLGSLLDSTHYLLPLLGSRVPLEAAIGMNGRVWIHSKEPSHIIAIARCISNADPLGGGMDEGELRKFIHSLNIS